MPEIEPTVSCDIWKKRVDAAITRREEHESCWEDYARLFAKSYVAHAQANEDETVYLPNGDQVRVGLVFRNIEQTKALLDIEEVGIVATAQDFTRELGQGDTHREAVVQEGLNQSLLQAGLFSGPEVAESVKEDGIVIGHGVAFTSWEMIRQQVEQPPMAVMQLDEALGEFLPVVDEKSGEPMMEPQFVEQTVWEGAREMHISPINFLFSSAVNKIAMSPWYGHEAIVELDELKADERYEIPDDVEPQSYVERDIYGEETEYEAQEVRNAVKVITLYDRTNAELLTYLDAVRKEEKPSGNRAERRRKNKRSQKRGMQKQQRGWILIGAYSYPIEFGHPDVGPYKFFVPIPANDMPYGISQIEHIKNPATEADKLRSREANMTRQLKRILGFRQGAVDQDQLDTALRQPDFATVGFDIPEGQDPEKMLWELPMPRVHPELFQGQRHASEDVHSISGIPEVPYSGADTATESENMMAVGGARPARKKRRYLRFLSDCAKTHKAFLEAFAEDGQTIPITTLTGETLNLPYGREAFQGRFDIKVLPGAGANHVTPVRQKMLTEMVNLFKGQLGPEADLMMAREVMSQMDVRSTNEILGAARRSLVPPQQPAGGQGQQAASAPLSEMTNGQTIRSAINAINEG